MADSNGQNYDANQAEEYSSLVVYGEECEAHITNWLFQHLQELAPCRRIIDAGCGSGRWYESLASFSAASYLGVDISAEMLSRFPTHSATVPTELIQGDVRGALEARPHQVDLVLSSFNTICFPDPEPVIRACLGALAPGGLLLLTTNVHAPDVLAPDIAEPSVPTILGVTSYLEKTDEHRGLTFDHDLQLADGQVIHLNDFFHTLSDYTIPLTDAHCEIEQAHLYAPQGDRFIPSGAPHEEGLFYAKLCILARSM
jgi:SAM-dependent methyltransferase